MFTLKGNADTDLECKANINGDNISPREDNRLEDKNGLTSNTAVLKHFR